MFDAFPKEFSSDVSVVLSIISKKTYQNIQTGETEYGCSYTLLDGQSVRFPYRIYYLDEYSTVSSSLSSAQKMIYHCIFSRSCDGFVREKHIKAILEEDYPDWTFPYILKIADEYVVEILETIYNGLKRKGAEKIKAFCFLNLPSFVYGHCRMVSYWNEFYRNRYPQYKNYIGRKLFSECFGYTKSMEKHSKKRDGKENMDV